MDAGFGAVATFLHAAPTAAVVFGGIQEQPLTIVGGTLAEVMQVVRGHEFGG